jgi:hypothetical protein
MHVSVLNQSPVINGGTPAQNVRASKRLVVGGEATGGGVPAGRRESAQCRLMRYGTGRTLRQGGVWRSGRLNEINNLGS